MKVIEFHPDDLLDREITGALSASDRVRLDEHLARCASCRLERQLRSDFDEELDLRGERPSLQSFVTGAIQAARASESPPPASTEDAEDAAAPVARIAGGASAIRGWRRRFMLPLAATLLFATGMAAAETELGARSWAFARAEVVGAFAPGEGVAPSERARVERGTAPAAPAAAPSQMEPPAIPVAIASAAEPPAEAPAAIVAPVVAPSAVARPAVAPSRAVEGPAARLFDRANTARTAGYTHQADALYRELEQSFPRSPEARLSLAVVARMHLDRGDNGEALDGFEAYLATGDGALRQEAMEGRALALGRLGRRGDEREAWKDLLVAYPSAASSSLARARLGQDTL